MSNHVTCVFILLEADSSILHWLHYKLINDCRYRLGYTRHWWRVESENVLRTLHENWPKSLQDFMVQRSQIKCGKSFILFFCFVFLDQRTASCLFICLLTTVWRYAFPFIPFPSYSVKIITFCRYCKVHDHIYIACYHWKKKKSHYKL